MPAERFRGPATASSSMSACCETCLRTSCICGSLTLRSGSNARVRRSTRHSQQLPPLRLLIPALEVKAEQQNTKIPGNDPWKSVSALLSGRDHGRDGGRDGGHHQIAVSYKWRHPAELDYIEPRLWDEGMIINYLLTNAAFSFPPRDPSTSSFPWVKITPRNPSDGVVTVPRGYRIPVMFSAKFMWDSLRLVLESPTRTEDWEECKFDILHVARLCARFLGEARRAQAVGGGSDKEKKRMGGMHRAWRCATFDRTLIRYFRRWLVSREDFVREFWLEFDEDEFEVDVLKRDWTGFALKGHKGFCLTRDEIQNGISFDTLTNGLTRINGRWSWDTSLPRCLPPMCPTSHVPSASASSSTSPSSSSSSSSPSPSSISSSSSNATPMDLDTNTAHLQTQTQPRPRPQSQPQLPKTPTRYRSSSSTTSLFSSPLSAAPSLIDLELDGYSPSLQIKRELVEAGLLADPDVLAAEAHKQEYIEHTDWLLAHPNPESGYHTSGAPERPIVVGGSGALVAYPSPVSDVDADAENTGAGGEEEHGQGTAETLSTASTLALARNLDSGEADDSVVQPGIQEIADVQMGNDTATVSLKLLQPEQTTEQRTNNEGEKKSIQPGTETRSSATSNAPAQEVAEMCLGRVTDAREGEGKADIGIVVVGQIGDRNNIASSNVSAENAKDSGTEEPVVDITKFLLLCDGRSIPCGSECPAPPHPVPALSAPAPSSAPPVPQTRFVLMRENHAFLGPRPLPVGYHGPPYSRSESKVERENLTLVTQAGPGTDTRLGGGAVSSSAHRLSFIPNTGHSYRGVDTNANDTSDPPVSTSGSSFNAILKINVNLLPDVQQQSQERMGQQYTEQEVDTNLRAMCNHLAGGVSTGKAVEGGEWAKKMSTQRNAKEGERLEKEANSANGMGAGMGWGVGIGAEHGLQPGLGKRKRDDGDEDGNGSWKRKAVKHMQGGVGQILAPAHVAVAGEWIPGQTESSLPAPKTTEATTRSSGNILLSSSEPRSPSPPLTLQRDVSPGGNAMVIGDDDGCARSGLVSLCHETLTPGVDDEHPQHTTMPRTPHTSSSMAPVNDGVTILGVDGLPSHPEKISAAPSGPPSLRLPSQPNSQRGPCLCLSESPGTGDPPPITWKFAPTLVSLPQSQPKRKPQCTKRWNERVAAAMDSARQVSVRGHEEGGGDVDGFLAIMEGLKVPEQELEPEHEHRPVTTISPSVADAAAASASASTAHKPPADAEHRQRGCELMTTEPTVAGVWKDSAYDGNTEQVVAAAGIRINGLPDMNMVIDHHESANGHAHPLAISEQNQRERSTSSTATNTEQDAAPNHVFTTAAARIDIADKDMMVDVEHDLPPTLHPFAHATSAIARHTRRDKVMAERPVQKHNPDVAQGITSLATGVGTMDRDMAIERNSSPRVEHHTTVLGIRNDNDIVTDVDLGAPPGGSGLSTEVGRNGSDFNLPGSGGPTTASDLLRLQPSSSISQTYTTLVESVSIPAPAPVTRPCRNISQVHAAAEPTTKPMDHGPVVTKVVSMFRDTLVGLTDILEIVGREDAKKVVVQPSTPTPSVSVPLPRTPSTLHGQREPEGSTSASVAVVSQLLDEIKGLRQQMQEEKEHKEEWDKEVRRLQGEMNHLRREIGMLDFRTPPQAQTNDDDGIVDMDISPSSSVPVSPFLSTPASTSRKRRLRDLDDNDRTRSPHPLSHLLTPTLPLPLRLPQRMSRMSITPLVPPFEGESTNTLSIASTPAVLTPPPTDLLPSSMTSLRTPSPCPKSVPYDGVPLPIKSQRKQHMLFQSDHQQN